jgi:hypothetical protein
MTHEDDAKDEADFQLMKAQLLASMKPDANRLIKVYALLAAAAAVTPDQKFLEEAFSDVLIKYYFKG